MSIMLKVIDKEIGAAEIAAPDLLIPLLTVSAREILRLRVEAEVERYNETPGTSALLVEPHWREAALNPDPKPRFRALKLEPQVAMAIEAVEKRPIIMLLDGRQVTNLDEKFVLTPASEARFVRLVPLRGG
ncbi:MAG TPA: hypothetical protein VHU22_06510 [Xanthobacteraceae bacterium]|jgi:hypothetical protein|nr:hypothetical protein [Xanthobacteraceae bacterium]